MRRMLVSAASIGLAISLAACDGSRGPTDPATSPDFGGGPPAAQSFQAEFNRTTLISASCDQGICDLVFQLSGSANIMGPITAIGHIVQDFTVTPCNPAPAEIELTGATGSITLADVDGTVCPSRSPSGVPESISATWEVTGGTGEFDGISGSGFTRGTIGANGPVLHLSGTVSY